MPDPMPTTVGLCPYEGCQAEFFMPDAKQGDRCPMDHSWDEDGAPELMIYVLAGEPDGGEGAENE